MNIGDLDGYFRDQRNQNFPLFNLGPDKMWRVQLFRRPYKNGLKKIEGEAI